jgi:hypothetical protein
VAENPLELLEKAFYEEVTTHPEMNDYLWLGVMVMAKEPFPWQVGTTTTRNEFVHIRNSLWGFYRCKHIESGQFAELEADAVRWLYGYLENLTRTSFQGLYLQLLGNASRIRLTYDPLIPPAIAPPVRLLEGSFLKADMVQDLVQQGPDSTIEWIRDALWQRGKFYDVSDV